MGSALTSLGGGGSWLGSGLGFGFVFGLGVGFVFVFVFGLGLGLGFGLDPDLHLDRLLFDVLLEALADLAVLRVAIRVGAAGERALARHEAHHLGAQLRRRVLDEVAPG